MTPGAAPGEGERQRVCVCWRLLKGVCMYCLLQPLLLFHAVHT